jgi:hypothetical protein
MAHFAELDGNNVVLRVIVVHNNELLDADGAEQEALGQAFCVNLLGGNWKQTSYNGTFRNSFAVIGGVYNSVKNVFIPPRPGPEWSLNEETSMWGSNVTSVNKTPVVHL